MSPQKQRYVLTDFENALAALDEYEHKPSRSRTVELLDALNMIWNTVDESSQDELRVALEDFQDETDHHALRAWLENMHDQIVISINAVSPELRQTNG